MSSTDFIFLNTTADAPSMSRPAAKRMRGHITRSNFAKRRARKAKAESQTTESRRIVPALIAPCPRLSIKPPIQESFTEAGLALALSAATSRASRHLSGQLLNEFWSVIFISSRGARGKPNDLEWLSLLTSEPALVEATMAVALRYWSPDSPCRTRSEEHNHRALSIIIHRVASDQAYTDGFLGAALTMAIGERMMGNDATWEIHLNGVADAIRERRIRGICGLPSIFADLVILDSINQVFNFPRVFHWKILDELDDHGDGIVTTVAAMAQSLTFIRRFVNMRDRNADQIPLEAEEAWMRLHVKTRMLQSHDNSYVRATAKAAQLILNLSSAPKTGGGAEALATELKDALCQLPGRSCVYMDMTSCHIMIGAIAAERGSETETWFVKKLRPGVKTMQSRGWGDPFGFLERTFMADLDMLQQLRGLREGIMKDS